MKLRANVIAHIKKKRRKINHEKYSCKLCFDCLLSRLTVVCSVIMILLFLAAVLMTPSAMAATMFGYSPQQYDKQSNWGTGLYFAPHLTEIYANPDTTEKPIATIKWGHLGSAGQISFQVQTRPASSTSSDFFNTFLCFYPELELAVMPVLSENGDGWAEVLYDLKKQKSGWVKLREKLDPDFQQTQAPHLGVFQSWLDFMRLHAKDTGVFWLSGVPCIERTLHTAPEDKAKLIETTAIVKLQVKHVRGNWLLVEATDFDHSSPIGWVRWRDDDGHLMVFPNLSKSSRDVGMGVSWH